MLALKIALDAFDPRVFYMLAGAVVWLLVYAWRRFLPGVWAAAVAKNPALPQLWMAVVGSLLALQPALGKPLLKAIEEVLITAALATIGANGLHQFLREMPRKLVPYDGACKKVAAAVAARKGEPPPGEGA